MNKAMEQVRQDLPHLRGPVPGPRAQAIIERDTAVMSPSYTRCYPLVVERGEGAVVEDVDGNRFLDFNAGIAVVATGHCHPRVVEAIQQQAARLIHMSGTDFYYEEMVALAEKLAAIAPGDVARRVSFGNSGAEAIEGAIKLARWSTKRDKIIAFFGSFHGRTMGALSLTARKATQRAGFGPMLPGVVHAPYPNCYRCPFGQREENCAVECVKHIEDVLLKTISPAEETAAIVVEPVQGEGGYVVPPQKFFDELTRVAHENGILLVCDEVQAGMGRTGENVGVPAFRDSAGHPGRGQRNRQRNAFGGDGGAGRPDDVAARGACVDVRRQSGGMRSGIDDDRAAGGKPRRKRGAYGAISARTHDRLAGAIPECRPGAWTGTDDRYRAGPRSGDSRARGRTPRSRSE